MKYKKVFNRLSPAIKKKYKEDWSNIKSRLVGKRKSLDYYLNTNCGTSNQLIALNRIMHFLCWSMCVHGDLWVKIARRPEDYIKNRIRYEDKDENY